jgi:hypothetical protein
MTAKLMAAPLVMLIVFSIVGLTLSSGAAAILQTTAFAQTLESNAISSQDSSSNDNVLDNENDFGDDGTAIGQDNEAHEDAVNLGVQDQETTQEQDQTQDSVNTNLDFDAQIGIQRPPPPPPEEEEPPTQPPGTPGEPGPPGPIGPPPEEEGVFCVSAAEETLMHIICFNTEEECEEFRANPIGSLVPISECERFEEPPPGALEPPPSP